MASAWRAAPSSCDGVKGFCQSVHARHTHIPAIGLMVWHGLERRERGAADMREQTLSPARLAPGIPTPRLHPAIIETASTRSRL